MKKINIATVFSGIGAPEHALKKLGFKTNDAQMFIKSIFPKEFERVLVECYTKNDY